MTDRDNTTPAMPPVHPPQAAGPPTARIPGTAGPGTPAFPAAAGSYDTTPQYTTAPVAVRRPDVLAGLLLLLAGAAAALSLVVPWVAGENVNGLDLLRTGFIALDAGIGEVAGSGLWQPLAVVLGGGVLAVLGLLMFVPTRRHRVLGLLALAVSLAIVAAVLVPLARAGWDVSRFAVGFWFALAVAALGLLGSLKAAATGRRYGTRPATV